MPKGEQIAAATVFVGGGEVCITAQLIGFDHAGRGMESLQQGVAAGHRGPAREQLAYRLAGMETGLAGVGYQGAVEHLGYPAWPGSLRCCYGVLVWDLFLLQH